MQVLQGLLRGNLAGEGDFVKNLDALGYRVTHQQDPRLEYDFSISRLSADLKDGLRLCRLAEILTGALTCFHLFADVARLAWSAM